MANGKDCLACLRRAGPWETTPRPDLPLLDINMPFRNGLEVMAEINNDHDLCSIPVIAMSPSMRHEDALRMYTLGCRSYISRPFDFERSVSAMRSLVDYWFSVVELPTRVR